MRRTAGWIAIVAALSVAAAFSPLVTVAVIAAALVGSAWRWPNVALAAGALASLLLRPSLDMFSERRLNAGILTLEPAVLFGMAILIVGATVLLRRARGGRPAWPDGNLFGAHVWLAGAYGILFISGWRLYGTLGLGQGVRELARVGSVVSAFLVLWWWLEASPARRTWGWVCLCAGAVPPIAVSLYQLATGTGFPEPGGVMRIQGTFSHPNSLAQFLAPLILVAVAGAPRRTGWGRAWRLGVAVGLALLLALTYSRTGILVLATGLVALLALQLRAGGDRRMLARGALLLAVFALLGWLVAGGFIRERFADVSLSSAVWQEAAAGTSENSFTWRLINWRGLIVLGLAHPWMGHGAMMTIHLNPLFNSDNGVPFNAHNDFVRFFFEGGLLGLLCYVGYGALLCRWAVRRAVTPEGLGLAAALVAMFFLTAGTTELSLHTANLYTLYSLLALVTAPAPAAAALPPLQ